MTMIEDVCKAIKAGSSRKGESLQSLKKALGVDDSKKVRPLVGPGASNWPGKAFGY
jgi:hypothetical protein